MFRLGQLFLAACVFCFTEFARGDSLNQWNIRASDVTFSLNSVAYGTDQFVAVGASGTIVVSTNNGTTWNSIASGVTNSLNGIARAQNLFVAVGNEGTILTSPDAVLWTRQNSPVTNPLRNVRFVGERFIATGDAGKALTSVDGVDWTSLTIGETAYRLEGAAYGNGIFCIVGGALTGVAVSFTSANGVIWSKQHLPFGYLYDVTFGNNVFVATGRSGRIATSTNGIAWTSIGLLPADELYGAAFAQGLFVVAGGHGSGNWQKIVTSVDGVNWINRVAMTNFPNAGNLQSVAYGNGYFVAVGRTGLILQSDSIFRLITGNLLPNGQRQLTLTGEVGRNYRIQFTENLGHTNWTEVTNFISSSEATLLIDPAPGSNERFYRAASP